MRLIINLIWLCLLWVWIPVGVIYLGLVLCGCDTLRTREMSAMLVPPFLRGGY